MVCVLCVCCMCVECDVCMCASVRACVVCFVCMLCVLYVCVCLTSIRLYLIVSRVNILLASQVPYEEQALRQDTALP